MQTRITTSGAFAAMDPNSEWAGFVTSQSEIATVAQTDPARAAEMLRAAQDPPPAVCRHIRRFYFGVNDHQEEPEAA